MIRRGLIVLALVMCAVVIPALPSWACEKAYFSPASYTVSESGGSVVLTVQNPFPREGPRTVEYATVTGTAKSGSDYVGETGTLSFSGNETTKNVSIKIVDDSTGESDERFYVKLKLTPDSCIVAVGPAAMVTIEDQDVAAPQPAPPREDESTSTPPPDPPEGSAPEPDTGAVAPPLVDERPSPATPTPTGSTSPPERGKEEASIAAAQNDGGGGLPWFVLAGIVFGVLLVGSTAVVYVRDRFLTTPPPS